MYDISRLSDAAPGNPGALFRRSHEQNETFTSTPADLWLLHVRNYVAADVRGDHLHQHGHRRRIPLPVGAGFLVAWAVAFPLVTFIAPLAGKMTEFTMRRFD